MSTIRAPTYIVAKYLASLLEPRLSNASHHVRNAGDFVCTLDTFRVQTNDILVSIYVVSLSTSVHVRHFLNLLRR